MTHDSITMSWTENAACKGKGHLFFEDDHLTIVRKAKAVCATCPVVDQCLVYAMDHNEFGVWGGMTANERKNIRRREKRREKMTQFAVHV
jgi:WhiB family redox-sensing transcriptional regulator